jgi:glycerate kinase
MQILIAPDKFKGSLTSQEVIAAIKSGLKRFQGMDIVTQPLADGGEGSLDIIEETLSVEHISMEVQGPRGEYIKAYYLKKNKTAFIEMAQASGLPLIAKDRQDPLLTSTFGTGQLIKDAVLKGCQEVNLLIGGSATNDCGLGMAKALGFDFLDDSGTPLPGVGADLAKVAKVVRTLVIPTLSTVKFKVLTDVQNPLFGSEGAARIYAKQKGADEAGIEVLESGAVHLTKVLANGLEKVGGAGAAGGLGYGAMSFLNAQIVSGIDEIMRLTGIEEKVKNADLVITGEGRVDHQSLQGKVIDGVKRICNQHDTPMAIICGQSTLEAWDTIPIYSVMQNALNIEDAIQNASAYVSEIIQEMMSDFHSKST